MGKNLRPTKRRTKQNTKSVPTNQISINRPLAVDVVKDEILSYLPIKDLIAMSKSTKSLLAAVHNYRYMKVFCPYNPSELEEAIRHGPRLTSVSIQLGFPVPVYLFSPFKDLKLLNELSDSLVELKLKVREHLNPTATHARSRLADLELKCLDKVKVFNCWVESYCSGTGTHVPVDVNNFLKYLPNVEKLSILGDLYLNPEHRANYVRVKSLACDIRDVASDLEYFSLPNVTELDMKRAFANNLIPLLPSIANPLPAMKRLKMTLNHESAADLLDWMLINCSALQDLEVKIHKKFVYLFPSVEKGLSLINVKIGVYCSNISEETIMSCMTTCPRLHTLEVHVRYKEGLTDYLHPENLQFSAIKRLEKLRSFSFTADVSDDWEDYNEQFLPLLLTFMPNLQKLKMLNSSHWSEYGPRRNSDDANCSLLLEMQPHLRHTLKKICISDALVRPDKIVNFLTGCQVIQQVEVTLQRTTEKFRKLVTQLSNEYPTIQEVWITFALGYMDWRADINRKMEKIIQRFPVRGMKNAAGCPITWSRADGSKTIRFVIKRDA